MKRLILVAGLLIALLGLVLVMTIGPAMMMASFTASQRTPVNGNISEICSAGEAGGAQIPEKYREDIAKAAEVSGISQEVLASQIYQESRWNPKALSSSNAKGLAQFKDDTWPQFGVGDPFDGHASIAAQGKYLAKLKSDYRQFSSNPEDLVRMALSGYRLGPSVVFAAKGIPYNQPVAMQYVDEIFARASVYTTECKPAYSGGDVVVSGDWTHPLPGAYFTSGFGYRGCVKNVGCSSNVQNHNALDFSTGGNGTVIAATAMKVTTTGGDEETGVFVRGRQIAEPGYVFTYLHCVVGSVRVQAGQTVAAGTALCTEGESGDANGRHLHFQMNDPSSSDQAFERNTAIDPEPILIANGVDVCPPGRDTYGICLNR